MAGTVQEVGGTPAQGRVPTRVTKTKITFRRSTCRPAIMGSRPPKAAPGTLGPRTWQVEYRKRVVHLLKDGCQPGSLKLRVHAGYKAAPGTLGPRRWQVQHRKWVVHLLKDGCQPGSLKLRVHAGYKAAPGTLGPRRWQVQYRKRVVHQGTLAYRQARYCREGGARGVPGKAGW